VTYPGRVRFLLAIALGVGLLALPAQAAQQEGSATRTIRLVATNGTVRVLVDRAPKGKPSKGDVVQERTTLSNAVPQFGRKKGAVVGSDIVNHTLTAVGPPPKVSLKLTAKLPGGTIRATGSGVSPTIKVVGGTGAFANARGTLEVRDHNGPRPGVLNTYRLQLP
jgi:hypothetical protein